MKKKRAANKLSCTWYIQCINYTTQQSSLPFQGIHSQMPNSGNHSRLWSKRDPLMLVLLFRIQILAKKLHYWRFGSSENKVQWQSLFCSAHQSLEMTLEKHLCPRSFRMGVGSWTEKQNKLVIQVEGRQNTNLCLLWQGFHHRTKNYNVYQKKTLQRAPLNP